MEVSDLSEELIFPSKKDKTKDKSKTIKYEVYVRIKRERELIKDIFYLIYPTKDIINQYVTKKDKRELMIMQVRRCYIAKKIRLYFGWSEYLAHWIVQQYFIPINPNFF